MKLPCAVIEDLLPAYYDHSCSQESRQAVAAHLETCRRCRRLFADLGQELPLEKGQEPQLGSVERIWKRKKTFGLFQGAVAALLTVGIVVPLLVYLHYF